MAENNKKKAAFIQDASERKKFTSEFKGMVQSLDHLRKGSIDGGTALPTDISFSDLVESKFSLSQEDLFAKVGVNTKTATISNVFTMPDQDVRWVVPEIIRSAITLGVRQAPFYPNIIISDQPISQLSAIMPYVNFSDADPAKINEAETIPLGTISYNQKNVNLFKLGKGIKITDEVRNYVSLDVLAIFFRDFGIRFGYAMDGLLMDVLINGNRLDGSESAPVIGVTTPGSLVYRDLLRLWVRAARIGRNFTTIIGDEEQAIDLLDLPEFKERQNGTTYANLNVRTPIPNSADMFIHPGVDDDQLLLVDKSAAVMKLTAQALMLESERIVSNQTEATYATTTTGFSKMFLDAAVLLDTSVAFTAAGFPDYFNIDSKIVGVIE